jgi:hypothetical protein
MYARAFSLSYGLGESCGNVFVRRSAQKNRAVAALNSVELITTLLSCTGSLAFGCELLMEWFRS